MKSPQFQTFVNKASEEKRNYLHTYSASRVNKNQLRQESNKNVMIECRHLGSNWFEIDFRVQKYTKSMELNKKLQDLYDEKILPKIKESVELAVQKAIKDCKEFMISEYEKHGKNAPFVKSLKEDEKWN